jgi:hypothetical protein
VKRRSIITSLTALLFLPACLGDLSHSVLYENATTERLTIFPRGREYPGLKRVLESGASQRDNLLVADMKPETMVARIEAIDDSGSLVFCHNYTNGDLDRLGNRITLRTGEIQCNP